MRPAPKPPSALILAVAGKIKRDSAEPLSFLLSGDTVFFARHLRTHTHEPMSPTVKLIQGIYDINPELARKILRNRIFSTDRPTEMCLSMVKVAAKNFTFLDIIGNTSLASSLDHLSWTEVCAPASRAEPVGSATQNSGDNFWMSFAKNIADAYQLTIPEHSLRPLFERDRKVAAVLVSSDGKLLGTAVNRNSSNRTLHAEINLIQEFFERTGNALPIGSRIYSTLKPCKMCAGMIWHASENIQIIYDQFDPGPSGRSTILDPDSFERKRACSDLSPKALVSQMAYSSLQLRIAAR